MLLGLLSDEELIYFASWFNLLYSTEQSVLRSDNMLLCLSRITEAFVEADMHMRIKGEEGREVTLSGAIDDMEAYTKLTGL